LLRFARNDGEGGLLAYLTEIEAGP
jgi:hypothetical protein